MNRRIFTVYDVHDKQICWFDADDTIAIVAPGKVTVIGGGVVGINAARFSRAQP